MAEKKRVQTSAKAGTTAQKKSTAKSKEKKKPDTAPDSTEKTAKKKKPDGWQENIIRDSETAKQKGRNGGLKSGEVRRAKRDARETIQYMLGRMTTSQNVRNNLEELGFEVTEFSNMAALHGRLFTMAMGGNLEAYLLLMRMGGYEPEENRKERESLSSDIRRGIELNAKVDALGKKGDEARVAINMNDEDNNNDVIIYMPQIASEDDCQVAEKTGEADGTPDGEE